MNAGPAGRKAGRRTVSRSRSRAPAGRALDLTAALRAGERISNAARRDRRRALSLAQAFVRRARERGDALALAVALRSRAGVRRSLHRIEAALADYREALRLFRRERHALETARTSIGLIEALRRAGRLEEGLRIGRATRAWLLRAGERRRAARLDVNIGNLHAERGRHRDALACYARAERQLVLHGDEVDIALARFNRANALVALDRPREAVPLYAQSAATWKRRRMDAALAQCRLASGAAQFQEGRCLEALSEMEAAATGARRLRDLELFVTAQLDMARVEWMLHRTSNARARLDEAIDGSAGLAMAADRADAFALRARVHAREGRLEEAGRDLDAAAALYRALGHRVRVAWTGLQRRLLDPRNTTTGAGRAALRRMAQVFQRRGWPAFESHARLEALERDPRPDSATARRQRARLARLQRRLRDPWIAVRLALIDAGRLRASDPDAAMAAYARAAAGLDRIRHGLPHEAHRSSVMTGSDGWIEGAIACAMAGPRGGAQRAFAWCERAHAPAHLDLVPWEAVIAGGRGGTARAAAGLRRERLRLESDPAQAPPTAGPAWRGRSSPSRRAAALHRIERHFHALELGHARRSGVRHRPPAGATEIRARLAPDEAVLSFHAGPRTVDAFLLTREACEHAPIRVPATELRPLVARLTRLWDRRALAEDRPGWRASLRATGQALLDALGEALLAPLAERPGLARRLAIVPHRWLRQVPFHALTFGRGPLAAHASVRYALSATALLQRHAAPGTGGVLCVGARIPDLPQVEVEARSVARLHRAAVLLDGERATARALARRWSSARLVHLAGHGRVCEDDARLSGLSLSRGAWTVYDLYARPSRADLVVLSACHTGAGVIWGSDDLVGLLPALLQTGARAVIASLWAVDDEITREMMMRLHAKLAADATPLDALQQTWSELRSSNDDAWHWAPFVLYGTP